MGTKNKPGAFDCYVAAHPDEPMFVLLGRDPMAASLVRRWANEREAEGEREEKITEARRVAEEMEEWVLLPHHQAEPGSIDFSRDQILPGVSDSISVPVERAFKGFSAERVEGVDYSALSIRGRRRSSSSRGRDPGTWRDGSRSSPSPSRT